MERSGAGEADAVLRNSAESIYTELQKFPAVVPGLGVVEEASEVDQQLVPVRNVIGGERPWRGPVDELPPALEPLGQLDVGAARDSKAGKEDLQNQPVHVVPAGQVEDGPIQLLHDEGTSPVHQFAVHRRGGGAEAADPFLHSPSPQRCEHGLGAVFWAGRVLGNVEELGQGHSPPPPRHQDRGPVDDVSPAIALRDYFSVPVGDKNGVGVERGLDLLGSFLSELHPSAPKGFAVQHHLVVVVFRGRAEFDM